MKAKLVLALVMPCVCTISGCYCDLRLHPVTGPLAAEVRPPVLKGRLTEFRSHNMTATLPGGEICEGTLTALSQSLIRGAGVITAAGIVAVGAGRVEQMPTCATGPAGLPPHCDLGAIGLAAWGRNLYEDYIQTTSELEQATLTGNRGTILHIEIYWIDWPPGDWPQNGVGSFTGAALDNKGNIYKVN
jgi:hypothetical protein